MTLGSINILKSTGVQDDYLIGNPQMTFFKSVYRKHTNFSSDWIDIESKDITDFGKKIKFTIPREKGDMLNDIVLRIQLPQLKTNNNNHTVTWIENVGHAIIDHVELKIGNNVIDKHYGDFMEIHKQLNNSKDKKIAYDTMLGNTTVLRYITTTTNSYVLLVPLLFWFCKDIGLSLPLVALGSHDVEIYVKFKNLENLIWKRDNTNNNSNSAVNIELTESLKSNLIGKFYKLDELERKRFQGITHRYLIEQTQLKGPITLKSKVENVSLDFNLPVKELIWYGIKKNFTEPNYKLNTYLSEDYNMPFNFTSNSYSSDGYNMFRSFGMNINGLEYFSNVEPQIFNLYYPFRYHQKIPNTGVYIYSFAEKPNEYQPSGSCNFSRLDISSTKLILESNESTTEPILFRIYAINYNILEINGNLGQASLSYFN